MSTAQAQAEPDQGAADLQAVKNLLGGQTAIAEVSTDSDTAVQLTEDGTAIDVPRDPSSGISIQSASGFDVVVTPLDDELDDFRRSSVTAVAAGDGYSSVAQPLDDGGFRMAVVLEDDSAPTTLSYKFDMEAGVQPVLRADGGYDFVNSEGVRVGGLGAPWALDAAGRPLQASYKFAGNVLTRSVATSASTAFPVITNWCMFGSNPNGSCRGSRWVKPATQCAGWGLVGGMGVVATGGTTSAAWAVGISSCLASQL